MLQARGAVMRQIKEQGGAQTCFGTWLSTEEYEERSILAQISQAVELQLLFPVVELARSTDEFVITLWQHDGFSIDVTDDRRVGLWKGRIQEEVKAKALQRGIQTELEEA